MESDLRVNELLTSAAWGFVYSLPSLLVRSALTQLARYNIKRQEAKNPPNEEGLVFWQDIRLVTEKLAPLGIAVFALLGGALGFLTHQPELIFYAAPVALLHGTEAILAYS